jgi:hypothetical protein
MSERGRKAASSAEKPDKEIGIYDMLHDDKYYLHNPRRGSAVGTKMKKDLAKMIGIVKTT